MLLKSINTDEGRTRAWIRASLNEHSLERYVHLFLSDPDILDQHFETWAFIRDEVKP
jgi:sorting nexin-29